MASSEFRSDSVKYAEDVGGVSQSHRRFSLHSKPKRRHSIQVVSGPTILKRQASFPHGRVDPAAGAEASSSGTNKSDPNTHNKGRRQSISESIQCFTKSMSSSIAFKQFKAMHIGSNPSLVHGHHHGGHGGHDNRLLNKTFFRDILSAHYRQPDLKVTKFSMRTWSDGEILRSTNSNSIVMDLLLVGDTYACDGFGGSTRRRSQIILSQKQYEDRVYQSYRRCTMQYDVPQFVQTHPVYEVIHEVEVFIKMMDGIKSNKKKLKLIVKCPRRSRGRDLQRVPGSPTTSRTDADDLEETEERGNEQSLHDKISLLHSEDSTTCNTALPSNGSNIDNNQQQASCEKSEHLQTASQNFENKERSISGELEDKEKICRKSSADLIKADGSSSANSSRKESLTEMSLTAYNQRKFEAEREYKVYTQVIQDMWDYLSDEKEIERPEELIGLPIRYRSDPKLLLLSDLVESEEADAMAEASEGELEGSESSSSPFTHLILQDLFASDFQMAEIDRDENGLDFTHTILALAKLATFHAVSYCMIKEKGIDIHERYPFLKEESVYRPATSKVFARMQSNMTARLRKVFFAYDNGVGGTGDPVSEEEANRFLRAVNNMHAVAAELVIPNEKFGVICHGDLWRQNVLFSYGSCMETQSDSIGVRFDDLHLCRYSSCVTDILNFLFTTVDCDVRRDHATNFIAAYYDHFNKTVRMLAPTLLPIFTRDELLSEFRRLLMFGFLEGLCLFSTVFESQMRRAGRTVADLENMEKEEEERNKAAAKIDPRDCTWSGMVTTDGTTNSSFGRADEPRPRYSDYRDSICAIVTDVVRFKAQLPIGKLECSRGDIATSIERKHDGRSTPEAKPSEKTTNPTNDKKSLLITAL